MSAEVIKQCIRYIRYLLIRWVQEIILHTLFESGITHVRDLERYITDDVIRYGNRLNELEKKLVNAYNEVVSAYHNKDQCLPYISHLGKRCCIGGRGRLLQRR